jgi:two-component system sensor histidine kinase TctE
MIRLRSLLLRWVLLPTLALWAAGFAVGYLHSLAQAHEAYDRSLLGSALVLAESVQLADDQVVADLPYAALEMLRTDAHDRIFYRVIDRDGDRDADRHITGYEDLPAPPSEMADGPIFYDADYKGQQVRIVAVQQVVLDGGDRRRLLVQVAETLEARHQLTRRLVLQSAAAQLLLIALAAGLITFGVRKGLAPLKRLRDEVRRRGSSDLTPIDTRAVPREVAPLIHAINAHTERQRQLGEAQLRFVANASHQLKTPLTLLRAQVGQALMQTELEAMRGIVACLDQATEATGRLVGQLLSLARSEPGSLLDEQQLDLAELAHEATFELVATARAKGIDLGFESDGPLHLRGERVLLRELVTNLVHNAVTYTPAGGRVTVSVRRQDGRALLRVADDGPGIAPAERARAFERFQRLGDTGVPGSGLGLAIVKEICARHGADVTLADPPGSGRGLWVDVRWPAGSG